MNQIMEIIEESNRKKVQMFKVVDHIKELKSFIDKEELSEWNPLYYIYYPAKSSVHASKVQLKAAYQSLRIMEINI